MRPESLPKENAQMSRRYRHGHPNLTLFPEVDLSPRVDTSWSPGNNVPFGPPDVLHRRQRLRRCCSRMTPRYDRTPPHLRRVGRSHLRFVSFPGITRPLVIRPHHRSDWTWPVFSQSDPIAP